MRPGTLHYSNIMQHTCIFLMLPGSPAEMKRQAYCVARKGGKVHSQSLITLVDSLVSAKNQVLITYLYQRCQLIFAI